jgi:hypothetical protein
MNVKRKSKRNLCLGSLRGLVTLNLSGGKLHGQVQPRFRSGRQTGGGGCEGKLVF